MALVGLATGFAIVVLLNPMEGDHRKLPLPLAFIVALAPAHIDMSGPALAKGKSSIVTGDIAVLEQPFPSVPVTV